ncbi:DUF2027 domain-containing protein [Mariniphaga sediminis]|uniref:DUF2027 domain-containing protein n=1 Tax=Mariniphaga sediminis TaxID=1628158 RepID=A0A399D3T1_9BACT|nr:DUF2027 domain-containing protein [Mariniphaga sediminis]RIH65858.1 DUF2027 domain-containing protein [Mariniphaga sediminis]
MIKIGDKVKFLNDVGGGTVTAFIGKNMVKVENQDGFEVPCLISQLINVDDPALNKGDREVAPSPAEEVISPVVQEEESEGKILAGKDSPHFYFCCVPFDSKNPLGGDIDFYLVNDSNFTLLFRYAHFRENRYETILSGTVPPNSKENLETIGPGDLSDLPEYCFQLLYFSGEEKEWNPAVSKKFKINPVKFYKEKSFQSNSFFSKNALVYQIAENILNTEIDKLTEDDFRKVTKSKLEKVQKKEPPKQQNSEIIEVDLHIHELIDNTAGLSNKEILGIQMDKVETEMHAGIRSRAKRIVFIHGVGQGVLKQEVAKLLKIKFPKYSFQDASFKEYGYGATMVMLRKK